MLVPLTVGYGSYEVLRKRMYGDVIRNVNCKFVSFAAHSITRYYDQIGTDFQKLFFLFVEDLTKPLLSLIRSQVSWLSSYFQKDSQQNGLSI